MELVALFRGEPGERFRMDPLQLGGLRCPQQVVVAGHCRTGGRVVLRRGVGPTGREAAAGGAADGRVSPSTVPRRALVQSGVWPPAVFAGAAVLLLRAL